MSIIIGKTRATCPVCGGSGRVGTSRSTSRVTGNRIVPGPLVTAEQPCTACEGSGSVAQAEHEHRAPEVSA
jgi:DnaJ-class molecular chaperone